MQSWTSVTAVRATACTEKATSLGATGMSCTHSRQTRMHVTTWYHQQRVSRRRLAGGGVSTKLTPGVKPSDRGTMNIRALSTEKCIARSLREPNCSVRMLRGSTSSGPYLRWYCACTVGL